MCLNLLFCISVKSLKICVIFFMFFSTFVNTYFVVLGQLFVTTISLSLFIIEVILV